MIFTNIDKIYYGFSEILGIRDIYEHFPAFFEHFSVLITCLDSSTDLSNLAIKNQYLDNFGLKYRCLGNSIIVHAIDVPRLFKKSGIFVHFDEIYLIRNYSLNEFLNESHFTSDGFNFGEMIPEKIFEKLRISGAQRYLSDGCGLNFVCESIDVTMSLEVVEKTVMRNFGKV